MYEATFELEAITPLFMRGADQNKAEFRSASVKGVMRWWFRALAGGYFGNDIDALRKAEELVFGSAGKGGARRSSVDVIVDSEEFASQDYPLPMVWNKKLYTRIKASAIPPGTTFTVVLRSPNYQYLAIASYSLIAMSYFGGLGFRSNRGAGSVRIIDGPDEIMKQLPRSYEQFKMFPNWLIEKFGEHLCSIKNDDVSLVKTNNCFSYSVLSQNCSSVWLWEPTESLEDIYYSADENNLLDKFENKFKGWGGCPFGYKNYVFGLPKSSKKSRRASPMKVGVVVLDGKYWVRISVFKTSKFTQDSSVRVDWNCLYKFLRDIGATRVWPRRDSDA
ncbi:MAG: CRISPR-associated protein Cmr1 [Thermococcaceae archaeon]|nr:CRISPR-associated protein Cmr1 [Thermococcaceae archaeon]MDK2915113.1 CRISPR-associated protein Cmr1 [Thermococcaceae archaeon]